nr:Ig-like domain-containing protein [uncultured Roseateles sp.]
MANIAFSVRARLGQLFAATALCGLAACGGGGSGSEPAPPPPAPDPLVTAAEQAALSWTYRPSDKHLELRWKDMFSSETGYQVERQDNGSWTPVETVPAVAGSGSTVTWATTLTQPVPLRVSAVLPGRQLQLRTPSLATEVQLGSNVAALTLDLDMAEPVKNTVQLSVGGATGASSVKYFADLAALGTSSAGPAFSYAWDSKSLADGSHLLQAVVELGGGAFVELRRTVLIDNPSVTATTYVTALPQQTQFAVSASSDSPIATVELRVDGTSQGILTATNACLKPYLCHTNPVYQWVIANSTLGFGDHTFRLLVTDQKGEVLDRSQVVTVNSNPAVQITSPYNGQIVGGTLVIQGSVTDDSGLAEVEVKFGDVSLQKSASANFDLNFSLAGLANGSYVLQVIATDKQQRSTTETRLVQVQNNAVFSYQRIATLEGDSELLAVDGATALVRQIGNYALLKPGAAVDRMALQDTAIVNVTGWQLNGGRVVASGIGSDSGGVPHVYLWKADGQRVNLSKLSGHTTTFSEHPTIMGAWVSWNVTSPDGGFFVIRNIDTGEQQLVPRPTEAQLMINNGFSLITGTGGPKLLYFAQLVSSDIDYAVYLYDTQTQASKRLSAPGKRALYPMTDGTRVVWQTSPPGDPNAGVELQVTRLANLAEVTTITIPQGLFLLSDGLLAWRDGPITAQVIRADDGSSRYLIGAGNFFRNGGGGLLYTTNAGNKLFAWTPASGSRPLIDALPTTYFPTQGWYYFVLGGQLYRAPP